MTSIKMKFRKSSVKGKKGACFIQLIHCRKMTTMATGVQIYPKEWDAKKESVRFKHADVARAKELLHYQERLDRMASDLNNLLWNMEQEGMEFTVDMLVQRYRDSKISRSFFSLMDYRIKQLEENGQERTRQNYHSALRIFREFRQDKDLHLEEFTPLVAEDFEDYLKKKKNSSNTISFYMRILQAAYNYAFKKRWLKENLHPFRGVFTGQEKTVKRAVDTGTVRRLMEQDFRQEPEFEFARELFLFSLYTLGMTFIDMAHLKKENLKDGILVYRRHKTGQRIEVELPECALLLIEKHANATRESDYLLPILYSSEDKQQVRYSSALKRYNLNLKKISDRMGLKKPLTSYVSRHTWATIAKKCGVKIQVISEAMGHTSEETTRIYLDTLDRDILNEAGKSVVNQLISGENMLSDK